MKGESRWVSLSLIFSVAALFVCGLLMVFNTTSAQLLDRSLSPSSHVGLQKQLLDACVGLILGWGVWKIGYPKAFRFSVIGFVITTILCLLVFVPSIGVTLNGAKRWISCFGVTLQPSEFMKIFLPLFYIDWISRRKSDVDFRSFLWVLSLCAFPIFLILMEPDNGTALILTALLILLFFLSRIPWMYWAFPLLLLLGVGGAVASQMPHVSRRIEVYLHPETDLLGKGHQPHQAKIAAGSGRLWGRGLGGSIQKLNYLPEARSDYIAAIFAEEFGFVGIVGLIGLYLIFIYGGCHIATRAPGQIPFLIGMLFTFSIGLQAFLNLGVVSGLLPSKGTTLPFFSQGGNSLVVNIVSVFFLLDIARKTGNKKRIRGFAR